MMAAADSDQVTGFAIPRNGYTAADDGSISPKGWCMFFAPKS